MSSYLAKQLNTFNSSVQAASTKVAKRTTLAPPPESAPSPAPSNASNTSKAENKDNKRKREPTNAIPSQPADTGHGESVQTQVVYVIEYLKKKGEPKTLKEILQYLSQVHVDDHQKIVLAKILQRHDSVQFFPDAHSKAWNSGIYSHRPKINVKNKIQLIAYLQNKPDAQGVLVKDLKDGWQDCEDAIDELEAENKLLVTRTKKDNHARMVWSNDPTLFHSIDPEFMEMWIQTPLPSVDDLVRKLQEAGQKPASEDPSKRIKAATKPKEKKKRAPRKNGKTTNTHMQHLLKDFSHLKR